MFSGGWLTALSTMGHYNQDDLDIPRCDWIRSWSPDNLTEPHQPNAGAHWGF